jgi:hypothetical protein
MSDRLCVFAGNWRQYADYCTAEGLNPHRDAVYATPVTVMGHHFKNVVCVGTCKEQADFAETYDYVMATLDRSPDETATTSALPFTERLITKSDAEKIAEMRQLIEDAASLMHPVHTKEMKAWWERAREYVFELD